MVRVAHVVSITAFVGAMLLCTWAAPAQAALILQGTRVVFPSDAREVTLGVSNEGDGPVLAQGWIDTGKAEVLPAEVVAPFVVTPAVVRVDPGEGAMLRIAYSGEALPSDRESLFFLNVQETPPGNAEGANTLQFVFRSRVKLFYRPMALDMDVAKAPGLLQWKLGHDGQGRLALQVRNPSPYHVSFARIGVASATMQADVARQMLGPYETTELAFNDPMVAISGAISVEYEVINDFGARVHFSRPLQK